MALTLDRIVYVEDLKILQLFNFLNYHLGLRNNRNKSLPPYKTINISEIELKVKLSVQCEENEVLKFDETFLNTL